jgi:hypothetical protein
LNFLVKTLLFGDWAVLRMGTWLGKFSLFGFEAPVLNHERAFRVFSRMRIGEVATGFILTGFICHY